MILSYINWIELLYWMRNDVTSPKWTAMEGESTGSTTLVDLLCSKLLFKHSVSTFISNPTVIHSVKIWNQFRHPSIFRTFNMQHQWQECYQVLYSCSCPKLNWFWQYIFETFLRIYAKISPWNFSVWYCCSRCSSQLLQYKYNAPLFSTGQRCYSIQIERFSPYNIWSMNQKAYMSWETRKEPDLSVTCSSYICLL